MSSSPKAGTPRVAVLVDCDNVAPEIVKHALEKMAGVGPVVFRRGYGTHATLAKRWQDVLVPHAFTPCLQYPYASGKNTTDLALALDALEALLDGRADTFCLVTSDSDFAYLCRKLRERGAGVFIVGDMRSPAALRKACDQFFEWAPTKATPAVAQVASPSAKATKPVATPAPSTKIAQPKKTVAPAPKKNPELLVDAVRHLTSTTPGGKVGGNELMQYLSKQHPGFSPKKYGHAGLMKMVKSYELLAHGAGTSGKWTVRLASAK